MSSTTVRPTGLVLAALLVTALVALPVAVWLDLRNLSERALRTQASDLTSLVGSVRGYYTDNVVGRVLAEPGSGPTKVLPNYREVPGAIPIPATLSMELGQVISAQQANIGYRFVSDYPFKGRPPHALDDFEHGALVALRANPNQQLTDVSWSVFTDRVRLVAPIIMAEACVNCHNAHPDSPKRDWKVGDVRGIQEMIVSQPIATNLFSFKYLLLYFAFTATLGFGFITLQRRQATMIRGMNAELAEANQFLAGISAKLSRYLSPQIYKSIFTGEKDVTIHTERKKLTIFFSDIKDFTATTEQLQPEEITVLLNEYFTEMSAIALRHGGTIDKFIGDAMLIFFGDPQTQGTVEDAKACLRMAMDMRRRIAELSARRRDTGTEQPFRVRIGINTGFCNVGNFGSADRMDYTIIGAEANVAARLQSIAEPGHIVISYQTYALVRDIVAAHPLAPIRMKGVSREVVPYAVDGLLDAAGMETRLFNEHLTGLDFFLDPSMVDAESAERIRGILNEAASALEGPKAPG
jgi:class 3 adenylate cyclase